MPELAGENLQRLAEVLHALGATVRVENHGAGPVGLPPDGGLLAKAPILNLHLPGVGDRGRDPPRRTLELDFEACAPTQSRCACRAADAPRW